MVQTFLVEESKELIYDTDKLSEWKEKCEELGLAGQLELASNEKSPIPFESMNTVAERVYSTLCPAQVNFKDYQKTAIPLEVLGLIHLSVNEGYFKGIEIWYDDKSPDPLAVGYLQNGDYGHRDNYTIARWGDVLRPFDDLREQAIKRYINSQTIALKSKLADINVKLENIETNTQRYFDAQVENYEVIGF